LDTNLRTLFTGIRRGHPEGRAASQPVSTSGASLGRRAARATRHGRGVARAALWAPATPPVGTGAAGAESGGARAGGARDDGRRAARLGGDGLRRRRRGGRAARCSEAWARGGGAAGGDEAVHTAKKDSVSESAAEWVGSKIIGSKITRWDGAAE